MMMLRWWFIFSASAIGFGTSAAFGLVDKLWTIDQTKISFGIIALYFIVSAWIGWLTRRVEKTHYSDIIRDVEKHLNGLEEASDLCMRLAIIGTTLGFAIMVGAAFGAGVIITPAAIAGLASGLSLIYLVTAVGVLCSSLLNLQIVGLRFLCDK